MANTKTTALTALTAPVTADLAMVVDVSDTTMDAAGTNKKSTLAVLLGMLTSNVISGLTLSNNGTDASNDIDIAAGVATVSDGSAWHLAALTSTLVKQLDAAWAVGTNAGGLDTGTEANSTWYHVWLIQRSDTGVVDALFSTSATAPTMPTNYDRKRRIGAIYNSSGGTIDAFTQYGDRFLWSAVKTITRANNPGTSAVSRALQVPTGIKVGAIVNVALYGAGVTSTALRVSSLDQTDETIAVGNAQLTYVAALGTNRVYAYIGVIRTNTSGEVRTKLSVSSASVDLDMGVEGWVDPRGCY